MNEEMKKDWQIKKLGEVGTFIRGGNFSKKDFVENGFPCIHYGQIHMKFGIETFKHISSVPSEMVKIDRCAKKGDLVIAITSEDDEGSCKCTAWMGDYDVYVGGHIAIYRHTMYPKYVSYYFNSPCFQKDKLEFTHGFKVVEINPKDIAKISIPLPPLEEQKRIVAVLDKKFAQIEILKTTAEKNLQNAKQLFQSELEKAFSNTSWEKKKLEEICETGSGGTPLKGHKEYYENGNTPWLRSGEVCKKEITESELFITEVGLKNSSAKIFPINTVLVAMYGATAGQTGILKFESSTNQAVCGIFPNDNFIPEYLYYFFLSYKKQLVAQAVGGAQPNISQIKIRKTFIPLPPLEEQKRIVAHLDSLSEKVHQLEEIYTKQLADCDELKQSLLQKAFEGEL